MPAYNILLIRYGVTLLKVLYALYKGDAKGVADIVLDPAKDFLK